MRHVGIALLVPLLVLSGCGLPGQVVGHLAKSYGPGAYVTESTSQQLSVGSAPTVVLDSDAGSVDVNAGAAASVTVDAEKQAASRADLDRMQVSVSADSGQTAISFKAGNSGSSNGSVHFTITAPIDSNLQLQTRGGSIRVHGFNRTVKAQSDAGSIQIDGAQGSVDAQADAGSISISGSLTGANRAKADAGSINVTVPADSRLNITASADAGSISTDFGLPVTESGNKRASGTLGDGSGGTLDPQAGAGSIGLHRQSN